MNNGIGFFGLLAIVFIGLKLGEVGVVASWSWWAVLSPLWAPFVAGVLLLVLVVAYEALADSVRNPWRRK